MKLRNCGIYGQKPECRKIHTNTKKNIFTVRVTEHGGRLSREVVESLSGELLRITRTPSCVTCCREPVLAGGWTWCLEVPLTPTVLWFCGDGCGQVTVLDWIQLALRLAVCLLQQAKLCNNDVISAEMTCMTFGHLFCKVVMSRYLFLTVLGSWWIHKGLASSCWSSDIEVSSGEILPGKGSQHEHVGYPYSWLKWLFWGLRVCCFPCGFHKPFLSTCEGWDSPVLRHSAQFPNGGCL